MNRPSRAGVTSGIDTTSWMTLRWVRGTRYYRVHLEQDLWNGWLLTRVNGRRDSSLGRIRSVPSPNIETALLDLAAIAKRRRLRGYELMS
jgi:hypothetical protein